MGWINRVFKRNAPQREMQNSVLFANYQWFNSPVVGKYSDIYFYSLVNKMFNGLDNSRFINNSTSATLDGIADFLNKNAKHIIWNYWRDGFVIVDYTDPTYLFVYDGVVQKNINGEPIVPTGKDWLIHYADTYILKRKSCFDIISNELCFLDRLASSLDFLTSTYGSVGIITGKTMPMNAMDKEELNEQLQQNLGITRDRKQFIISRGNDFDIKQFSFDMAGLDLQGKIDKQYLLLADYFNIPKNILTTDTDSTYENQNAALRRFYTDCISPLCETILLVGRELVVVSNDYTPADELSFTFDNVSEINNDEVFLTTVERLSNVISSVEDEGVKQMLNEILYKKVEEYQ